MGDLEVDRSLFEAIYFIRRVEEKIREIYPSDAMKTPVHLSLGEEAVVAGVCQALDDGDQVYGTYRSHALFLARGGDLVAFFAELYGKRSGIGKGKAGSMHLSSPEVGFLYSSAVVGTILPVAVGAAFAANYKKKGHIVAVFFGDGAAEEGAFWESLNVSSLKRLPLLFVCEDNGLAIHTFTHERQSFDMDRVVESFGIPVYSIETTNATEIYACAREMIGGVRSGTGPAFLNLKYHRYVEHVGINEDYDSGYRRREDYSHWYAADPVKVQKKKLFALGVPEEEIRLLECSVEKRIEEAVQKAEDAPFPDRDELLRDVYA